MNNFIREGPVAFFGTLYVRSMHDRDPKFDPMWPLSLLRLHRKPSQEKEWLARTFLRVDQGRPA